MSYKARVVGKKPVVSLFFGRCGKRRESEIRWVDFGTCVRSNVYARRGEESVLMVKFPHF